MLAFIKYSRDADKLAALVNQDPGFHELGRREVDVLNKCVNANLTIDENEEAVDVCEAIQTIANRAAEKAAREAREAAEKAIREAREAREAAEADRMRILLQHVQKLMEKMNQTAEQAMDFLEVSEADREELRRLL